MRRLAFYVFVGVLFLVSCDRASDVEEPIACFDADKTSIYVNETIQFSNCSENADKFGWSFGDGGTSTNENPEHKYTEAGTYSVRLKAYKKNLDSEASLTIVVEEEGGNTGDIKLSTSQASQITEISAVCGGNITDNGGAEITQRGVCWSTGQQPTINDNYSKDGTGTGEFTSQLNGLTPETTYYVRAYAINENETAYGNQQTFTTKASTSEYPLISADPTDFSADEPVTIIFNAALGDKGLMGFDGDVYAHTGINTVHGEWRYNQADWTENIDKLKMTRISTDLYELKMPFSVHDFYGCPDYEPILSIAFVFRSGDGLITGRMENGEDIILDVATIEPFAPVVYTYDPTDITTNSVNTGGIVAHDGFKYVTKVGVCYNTTGNPTINDQQTSDGEGWIEFFTTLENLTENTIYYVKAYAINEIGVGYGREISFTTSNSNSTVIFEEQFACDLGQFQSFNIVGEQVWFWQKYDNGCVTMTGYDNGSSFANEDWLISPLIQLPDDDEAFLEFRHAINFIVNWDVVQVLVSTQFNGDAIVHDEWVPLEIPNWGTGDNWTFINSGSVSLQQYTAKTVHIAFKYTSYNDGSGTWEIGSVKVYSVK